MNLETLRQYTDSVLEFGMAGQQDEPELFCLNCEDVSKAAGRCHKSFSHTESPVMILLGFGCGELVSELHESLPDEARLVVCETAPKTARRALLAHEELFAPGSRTALLADTSPWAHITLLHLAGFSPQSACLSLNPEVPKGKHRDELQKLQRTMLNTQLFDAPLNTAALPAPPITAGAILHPDDSNLLEFFAQFPNWIEELVVVWDAEKVPEAEYACACPVRHTTAKLKDFSEQRNRMLGMCRTERMIYLDADERFSPEQWNRIPALAASDIAGVYFPRETLYPDAKHAKAGFGLWPDLQLRLFNTSGIRFERPIHERIEGLSGPLAIALDMPITHLSRLAKNRKRLEEKLARFDDAGEEGFRHRLNHDYPNVERTLFSSALPVGTLLRLPPR